MATVYVSRDASGRIDRRLRQPPAGLRHGGARRRLGRGAGVLNPPDPLHLPPRRLPRASRRFAARLRTRPGRGAGRPGEVDRPA